MGIRRVTLIGESKIGPEDDDVDVPLLARALIN
jgi:hypothetical protein